jgi:peptidyl-prolyl cis-trans isomerase SurA
MRPKRFLILLALALPALLAADTVVEEIVARINDAIITRSDLERARKQLMQELQQQPGVDVQKESAERDKDVLRDLIDQQLLVQKAADLGLNVDTQVIKRLDEMRKQMNLETMEDLEQAAAKQGVVFEDFKQQMRESFLTQQVISREVGARIQITQEETRKFYDEHQKELEQPEQVRLSEILVSPFPKPQGQQPESEPPQPTPEQVAQAEAEAKRLLESIRKGEAFEEVAKKSSHGPTAEQGGDIGFFKRGMLAKQLEDLVFSMKVGEVSDVIQTKQGFIILKLAEHQKEGIPPLKDVEARIQEAIYLEKLRPAMRTYLTKLREEAYIDIKEGYVDTAASPNQTKPVITAAVPEDEQPQKKKKKRFLIF